MTYNLSALATEEAEATQAGDVEKQTPVQTDKVDPEKKKAELKKKKAEICFSGEALTVLRAAR